MVLTRRRAFVLAVLVAVVSQPLLGARDVRAASYPNYTYSVYVTSMSGSAADTAGCNLGIAVTEGTRPADAFVVLDFGYPIEESGVWGTLLLTSSYPFESTSAISTVVENFANGYYACSPSSTFLRLAVGENSSNVSINGHAYNYFTGADGTAWADMVIGVNNWLSTNGEATQVSAAGGPDIENASGWASFTNAKAWDDSFSAATSYAYYDTGSANGCYFSNTYGDNPCSAGWNTYDEWYVSWVGVAFPAPEDYNQTYYCAAQGCSYGNVDPMSRQWEAISRYGYHYQGGAILIKTVVTQYEACVQVGGCVAKGTDNTPAQGDGDMYNALNHDYAPSETSQSIEWTTDVEWGYAKT